jgi:hypothetical protein
MADFCKSCSIEYFGKDLRDLAGITRKSAEQEGLAAIVICEGCGVIQVDHEGNCISTDCLKSGQPGHGMPYRWKGGDNRPHDRGKGFLNIHSKYRKGEPKC